MSLHDLKTAIRLHRNGKLASALEAYSQLVGERPDDIRLVSLLGQLQLQMGKADDGIAHLRKAVALAPDDQRIRLTLARGLAATGKHSEAIGIVHKLLAEDDASADAWAALATVHRHNRDHVNELVALERASELTPDDVPVLIAQANAQLTNGHLEKAIDILRHATTLAPHNPRIANNLGALFLRRNNLQAAEQTFQQAIRISPDYAVAVANLATTLHRMGKLDDAREVAERARQLAPDNLQVRTELASILMAQGDLAGAEAGFKAALELAPGRHAIIAGIAELRERQGRYDEGLHLIDEVVDKSASSANLRLAGAGLAHRIGRREKALDLLGPLLDEDGDPLRSLDPATRRRLCFLLGDICDSSADYKAALRHYTIANTLLRPDYDPQLLYQYVDNIVQIFGSDFIRQRQVKVSREPKRIFIVGLPRSGISLVESMLARHPSIHVCGELPLLGQLFNESGQFPAGFAKLTESELSRLGDRYCAGTAAPAETRWMTDKMPLNYYYLGAIAMTLPDAVIIHCKRYAADTLLSCYFQNFADPALAFSFDIENLTHGWRNYNRLMRHWHDCMGEMIFDLHYEELVADPEAVMRGLLKRLDLGWNWEVLNPKLSGRHRSPASQAQISNPIHSRSIGRFARYRPFWGDRVELTGLEDKTGAKNPGE